MSNNPFLRQMPDISVPVTQTEEPPVEKKVNPFLREMPKLATLPEYDLESVDLERLSTQGFVENQAKRDFFNIEGRSTLGQLGLFIPEMALSAVQGFMRGVSAEGAVIPGLQVMVADQELVRLSKSLEEHLKRPVRPEGNTTGLVNGVDMTSVQNLSRLSTDQLPLYQDPATIEAIKATINKLKNHRMEKAKFFKELSQPQFEWMKPPKNQSLAWFLGGLVGQGVESSGKSAIASYYLGPTLGILLTQMPQQAVGMYATLSEEAIQKGKGETDFAKLDEYLTRNSDGAYKVDELARLAWTDGLFSALAEFLPTEKILKGVPKGAFKRMLVQGSYEAVEEFLSQLHSNLTEYGEMENPEVSKIWEGLFTAILGGFLPGMVLGAGARQQAPRDVRGAGARQQAPRDVRGAQTGGLPQGSNIGPQVPLAGEDEVRAMNFAYDINDANFVKENFVILPEEQIPEVKVKGQVQELKRRKGTDGKPAPYYVLKPGTAWTPDTMAAFMELTQGLDKKTAQATTATMYLVATARGQTFEEATKGLYFNFKTPQAEQEAQAADPNTPEGFEAQWNQRSYVTPEGKYEVQLGEGPRQVFPTYIQARGALKKFLATPAQPAGELDGLDDTEPFYLAIPRRLREGETKLNPNVKLPGSQIIGRLLGMPGVKKTEMDVYKALGLEEFLKEKRTLGEVAQWMEENGPKVEVMKLEAVQKVHPLMQKKAELQHWFDTNVGQGMFPCFVFDGRKDGEASSISFYQIGHGDISISTAKEIDPNSELFKKAQEWDRVNQEISNTAQEELEPTNDSATAKYEMVNPKPLDQMPGAVDLLVRIPRPQAKAKQIGTGKMVEVPGKEPAKYPARETHYPQEGDNLLTHVRGYMETLPDGRKVFHVFEVQSDWAQQRRGVEEKRRKDFTILRSTDGKSFAIQHTPTAKLLDGTYTSEKEAQNKIEQMVKEDSSVPTDPLLPIYEKLALKAAIAYAKQQGATHIAISDAETAMLTEMHDQVASVEYTPGVYDVPGIQGKNVTLTTDETGNLAYHLTGKIRIKTKGGSWEAEVQLDGKGEKQFVSADLMDSTSFGSLPQLQKYIYSKIPHINKISQEPGMRLHYDKTLPKIAKELTGSEGEVVELGQHKNAMQGTQFPGTAYEKKGEPRSNLIFKNPDGTPKTTITARLYPIEQAPGQFSLFDAKKKNAKPLGQYEQLVDIQERIIKLFSEAQPDTLFHEIGHMIHSFLSDEQQQVVAQEYAKTEAGKKLGYLRILNLLRQKAKTGKNVGFTNKRGEHIGSTGVSEWFAEQFVSYLRRHKAPSSSLEKVFEACKEVLRACYWRAKHDAKVSVGMQRFFDSLLMQPSELAKGKLLRPAAKVDGKVVDGRSWPLVLRDGVIYAQLREGGEEKLINVHNLVMGGMPNAEQLRKFGPTARFVSAYWLEVNNKFKKTPVSKVAIKHFTDESLESLSEEQLRELAKKYQVENYGTLDRETLMEELMALKRAKAASGNVVFTFELDEDYQDAVWRGAEELDVVTSRSVAGQIGNVPRSNLTNGFLHLARWYYANLIDRVRTFNGGGVEQERWGQVLLGIAGETNRIAGLLERGRVKIQQNVRSNLSLARAELSRLHEVKWQGRVVGYVSEVAARIDEKTRAQFNPSIPLSTQGEQVLRDLNEYLDHQARLARQEKMGITLEREVDGKKVKVLTAFMGRGNRFPRLYTEDFWRAIISPNILVRKALAEAVAGCNPGFAPAEIEQWIQDMEASANPNQRIYLEMSRKIPVMPTHVVMPSGTVINILETDIFRYVEQLQMKFAMRLAFHKALATDPTGRVVVDEEGAADFKVVDTRVLKYHVRNFEQASMGGGVELQRAFCAANGVPVGDKFFLTPDDPMYAVYNVFHSIMKVLKALNVTTSWKWNVFEPFSHTMPTVGVRNFGKTALQTVPALAAHPVQKLYNKTMTKFFQHTPSQTAYERLRDTVTQWGAMHEKLAYWIVDPKNMWRSTSQSIADGVLKLTGNTGVYGFNEFFAALAANNMLENLVAGRFTGTDLFRLRNMGFTPQEIELLITGRASQELRQQVVTRIVPHTQGTNTLALQRSLAGHTKAWQDLLSFDNYGRTSIRYIAQIGRTMYNDRHASVPQRYRSAAMMGGIVMGAETLAGTTIAGFLGYMLMQTIRYGVKALLWNDLGDEEDDKETAKAWAGFFANCFMQGNLSGPLGSMWAAMYQGNKQWYQVLGESMYPVTQFMGFMNWAYSLSASILGVDDGLVWGAGYGGMTPGQTVRAYLSRNIPIMNTLPMTTMLSMVGLAYPTPEFALARDKYFKFMGSSAGEYKKRSDTFHRKMAAGVKIIQSLDRHFENGELVIKGENGVRWNRVSDYLQDALEAKIKEGDPNAARTLRDAILDKRMLPRIPVEKRDKFRRSVTPEVMRELEAYDELLNIWARKVMENE